MVKYGKDIVLTATDENYYRTARFSVSECDTPEEADKMLREWIDSSPELKKINGNKKIIDNTLKG